MYHDTTPLPAVLGPELTAGCDASLASLQRSECVEAVRLACIQLQLGRLGQDDARVLDLLRAVQRIMGDKAAGATLQRGASTLQAVAPGVPSNSRGRRRCCRKPCPYSAYSLCSAPDG